VRRWQLPAQACAFLITSRAVPRSDSSGATNSSVLRKRRCEVRRLARGSGRSANAAPGTGATAQRGHRGLERGDESTAIAALRSIISCSLAAEATLKYANNNRESCDISVPLLNQMVPPQGSTGSRQCLCRTPLRPYPADIIQR